MTEAEKESWQKVRTRGHWRFILLQGLVREGLCFGVVLTFGPILYDYFVHHKAFPPFWNMIPDFLIFTLGIGYFAGEMKWRKHENEYRLSAKLAGEK